MEFFAFIGAIVVAYVIYKIYEGVQISSELKSVVGTLVDIKFRDLRKNQVEYELGTNNIKYEVSDDGTLYFQIPRAKDWVFVYDKFGFNVTAIANMDTRFDGIEIRLNRGNKKPSEQTINVKSYYGTNKQAYIFMAKLPFYGVREVPYFR
jgi:hypothetical protein